MTPSGQDMSTTAAGPPTTAPAGWARTVILIQKQTAVGQDLFIRGGLDHSRHPGIDLYCLNNYIFYIVLHKEICFEYLDG